MQVEQIDREAVMRHQQRFLTEGESETVLLTEAFARHRHQARADVVGEIERLEERMAEAYQLAGSIAFDHDINGPEIERLLDLLAGVNLSKGQ